MSNSSVPLPPGWSKGHSRTLNDRPYYYHKESVHTQWHFPTPMEAKDPVGTKKRMAEEQQQKREQRQKNLPSVAIIVPYRDLHPLQNRAKHLSKFVPHMKSFLGDMVSKNMIQDYHLYIIEQSNDQRKFNRGKLLNIGFDYALKKSAKNPPKHNIFIFHDVDLLPQLPLAKWYAVPPSKPLHIARVWDRYSNNPKYFGGIVSFSEADMKRINGYPNNFWGWGGEDDEMQARCESVGLKWDAPEIKDHGNEPLIVDLEEMSLHDKLAFLKQNKEWKCMVKWEALDEHKTTWRTNGLADLNYDIKGLNKLDKDDPGESKVTLLTVDVKLNGDHWSNEKCGVDYLP
ncbi:hypothetical protein ACHAWO_004861 [Cyclotella atomus]|uniref:WW domain-containing protein n=1 Tax=Cyclotella atomus TaxID=382360 RepID=A0ABD3NBM7_9STRA